MARKYLDASERHHIPASERLSVSFSYRPIELFEFFDECEARHMRRHTAVRGTAVA